MPNSKSARKRMRQSATQEVVNRAKKSEIASLRRELQESIDDGNREKSEGLFKRYCSLLDRAAKKGVIARNTANRRKSRVAARLGAVIQS